LEGEPGAYGVTEKGEPYASERHFHRGPGGDPWYNRDWEQRTWSDEFADSLDIPADRKTEVRQWVIEDRRRKREERAASIADESPAQERDNEPQEGGGLSREDLRRLGLVVGAVVAANVAVYAYKKAEPKLRELWINKAAPKLAQLKARVTGVTGKAATQIANEADAASDHSDAASNHGEDDNQTE
jgi:hypothetical protein